MRRRNFLCLMGTTAGALASARARAASASRRAPRDEGWRTFEVTTRVDVLKPAGNTVVWLPLPLADDTPWQRSLGNLWNADGGRAGQTLDPVYRTSIVWAEFPDGTKPVLTSTSRVATRDFSVDLTKPGTAQPESAAALAPYLRPSAFLPTDGAVKLTSAKIAQGLGSDLDKARAIYQWVVENTHRDPKTRGCGTGDVRSMLEGGVLGGKCADLNALFVALARAEGIPARDVYGLRVAPSALGAKSLGREGGDVTRAQHCRAEFYLPTHGWVPVDPADVRKVVLEEDGGKALDDPMVAAVRARLFGSWEMNWVAYNYAHDLVLPGAKRGPVPFFMYPQAETADGRLDSLDAEAFAYSISARELS